MVTNISHSPAETLALGEAWGRRVEPGLVIALCGDLGAGKTQLVKGLALGLGIQQRVLSPTFALVNVYPDGRLPLFHLDLYRLDTREQILAAGLEEYFYPAGVAVVEWAEKWFGSRPGSSAAVVPVPTAAGLVSSGIRIRWVEIQITNESERRIAYEDFGA